MANEVILDFSGVSKHRKRSRRDIVRHWSARYTALLSDGFTDDEAQWGANNGLDLRKKQVRELRERRRERVARYMSRYHESREKAIERAAKRLEEKLQQVGITESNLFYEVSP